MNIVAVFIGGGLGSLFRYGLTKLFSFLSLDLFPIATLCSNMASSAILAWFVYSVQSKIDLSIHWKLFIMTGFCGGFSTFSTFSFETFELFKNGHTAFAILNIMVSIIFCFILFYIIFRNL
jgi:CrcB protein